MGALRVGGLTPGRGSCPSPPCAPTVPDPSDARGWAADVESVPIHFMHRGSSK
jgi:hypothetical protein